MIILPLIGKLSDKVGKYPPFIAGTTLAIIMVIIFTNLSPVSLWALIGINTLMFCWNYVEDDPIIGTNDRDSFIRRPWRFYGR